MQTGFVFSIFFATRADFQGSPVSQACRKIACYWFSVVAFILFGGVIANAQIAFTNGIRQINTGQNGARILSTTGSNFINSLNDYYATGATTNAEELASQDSRMANHGDGTATLTGTGMAQIIPFTAEGTNASAGSSLIMNFTISNTVSFTYTCSAMGNGTNIFSGPNTYFGGPTNTSGTLSAGTYGIIAACSTTATNQSTQWQFELDVQSSVKALGCDCPGASPYAGEPIKLGTGNVYEEVVDYTTVGANTLSFVRHYNSVPIANTPALTLGKNWRTSYDRYLGGGYPIIAERANGERLAFVYNGSNWISDSDVSIQLTQSGSTWTLVDNDDTTETYTAAGNFALLTSIQSLNGYQQTLIYNGNNQLINVTDTLGRTLILTYQNNLLHTVTAPSGLVLTYNYNASGGGAGTPDRLASVSYSTSPPSGQSYVYENAGQPFQLTGVVDEDGNRFSTWTYDSSGRALSSQHANGADRVSVFYNDADGSRTVTNALGVPMLYKFTMLQNLPKVTMVTRLATPSTTIASTIQTYDSFGYIKALSDWKTNVTSYLNEYRGLPTANIEALGSSVMRVTTNLWHQSFHRLLQAGTPRMKSAFTYDTNGNWLARVDTDITTNSTSGQNRTWTNTYGRFGQLLTATGPRTDVIATTRYTYDPNGNISNVTDPLGHVTIFTNYNGSGLPATMIDPNGVNTRLTYDVRDRLLTRTVLASAGNATNTFGYDAAGLLTSLTLPDGSRLHYQYDAAHRLQAMSNSLGESISYLLDANGDVTNQAIRSASGVIVKTQSRVFDALGHLLQDIGASSQINVYQYDTDGNRISATDGLNHKTSRVFDALNRVVSMTDPLTNTILHSYDPQDNLTSLLDARLLITAYVYDGFRQVIQETGPDTGTITYTLDQAGNRIFQTDARGVVTQRTFDALNRVKTETFPAAPGENITFTYDAANGGNFGIGRLTSYSDETGSTTLIYNERGDVISTTRTIGGIAYTTTNGYDLADHITSTAYPSGDLFKYTRDSQGRISSVSYRPSGSGVTTVLATNVTYLPFGPMSGLLYGNGLVRTLSYDKDYRLTNLTTSGSVQNLNFGYDTANNITSIADSLNAARSQMFGYDADYRLTNAAGLYGAVNYTYDADGNRLTKTAGNATETYNYSNTANLLQSVTKLGNTRSFAYTAAGNMSSDNRGTSTNLVFNYGNRNRYSSLTSGATTVATYKYNALGERLIKIVGAATTHFHYDEKGHLIAESQGNGTLIREYVWLDDMPLAQIEGGAVYFIHPDHLNMPQKMTDATQAIVWDLAQQPFGETAALSYPKVTPVLTFVFNKNTKQFQATVSGTANYSFTLQSSTNLAGSLWSTLMSGTVPFTYTDSQIANYRTRFYRAYGTYSTVTNNLRFPGQYFDAESGLNYNMMRDYDSTLGRYIQSDPIGLLGGISLYSYVQNHPPNGGDKFGLADFIDQIFGMMHEGGIAEGGYAAFSGLLAMQSEFYAGSGQYYSPGVGYWQQNAVRHATWSSLMGLAMGRDDALKMTAVHECMAAKLKDPHLSISQNQEYQALDDWVDSYNNNIGATLGEASQGGNIFDLDETIAEAFKNGLFIVDPHDPRIPMKVRPGY